MNAYKIILQAQKQENTPIQGDEIVFESMGIILMEEVDNACFCGIFTYCYPLHVPQVTEDNLSHKF